MWRFLKKIFSKTVIPYGLLLCLTIGFCWLFCWREGIFGSKIDWISQHSVIPDYFRQQFYETGVLFPQFAANLGGGQNIYHFSYYGLFSPIILLSYFFPFIKMSDYMMGTQFLCLAISVGLLFFWLEKRGFSKKNCFLVSIVFLLSGPMIFHSYNQIMFVNYMPFLCMSMIGVDQYVTSGHHHWKDQIMLVFGIFFMIMTSFYFSIGGMFALALYAIYRYWSDSIKMTGKSGIWTVTKEGMAFALRLLIPIFMSGILLVPTLFALSGRGDSGTSLPWEKLIIPSFSIHEFFYSVYGLGMTTLLVTALLSLVLFQKRQEKFLAGSCLLVLTVPLFSYCLNGGLYVRDKVFLPFLPLLCYILAYYVDALERRENFSWREIFPYLITFCILFLYHKQMGTIWLKKLIVAESILSLLFGCLFVQKRRTWMVLLPSIFFLALYGGLYHNQMHRMVSRDFYKEVTEKSIGTIVKDTLNEETGFYRMEQLGTDEENAANINRIWSSKQYVSSMYSSGFHKEYDTFRKNIFQLEQPFRNCLMESISRNPIFQRFMGVKYILSKKQVPGYCKRKEKGKWDIYENILASPVIYATDQVIGEENYGKEKFPYNQLTLLSYAVVPSSYMTRKEKKENITTSDQLKNISNDIERIFTQTSWIKTGYMDYQINSSKGRMLHINMKEVLESRGIQLSDKKQSVLFLQFHIKNESPNRDVWIRLNEEKNVLTAKSHYYYNKNTTFTYCIPWNSIKNFNLKMYFGDGRYRISDLKCFVGTLPDQTVAKKLYQSPISLNAKKTKGNRIEGSLIVKKKGYLITTIPYEKNFQILIDGKQIKTEKVNTAFLGCKISPGMHQIEIVYYAPGVWIGKMMTIVGVCCCVFLFFRRAWFRLAKV